MVSSKDHEEALNQMAENQQRGIVHIDELVQAKTLLKRVAAYRSQMDATVIWIENAIATMRIEDEVSSLFIQLIKTMASDLSDILDGN